MVVKRSPFKPPFSASFYLLFKSKMETAERAEILFNELDDDPDKGITEEEFIRWRPFVPNTF